MGHTGIRGGKAVRLVAVAALVLGLAACNTTGGSDNGGTRAADLPPLAPIARVFVRDAAVAGFLAQSCPTVRLRGTTLQGMLAAQTRAWREQGYTPEQIQAANRAATRQVSSGAVIQYVQALGVRQGDVASVCRVAARERARQTGIGRKLI